MTGERGMVITRYGNVFSDRSRLAFGAQQRFVALVDVLGMKKWVEQVGPEAPAAELDELMRIARDATSGTQTRDDGSELPLGPLVGAVLLSDSVLAYSVDDSWASLAVMGDFLRMLVMVALTHGIPMRGAMSMGKVVIDRGRGIFVGAPIVDAYLSDKNHRHRGVGVHVTQGAVTALAERTGTANARPLYLLHSFAPALFHGAQARGETFAWFENSLFVDHWGADFVAGNGDLETCERAIALLEERWGARGLPEDESTRAKLEQSREFFRHRFRHRSEPREGIGLPGGLRLPGRGEDLARLTAMGLQDGDAVVK
jgi:hypothetical protein